MKASFAERLGKMYEERQAKSKKQQAGLLENLLTVCFYGTPNNAIVAQSVLAKSFPLKQMYIDSIDANPARGESLPPMKKCRGRKKFISLRKVFDEVKDGKPVPK